MFTNQNIIALILNGYNIFYSPLLMKNIFIKLKASSNLKQQSVRRILAKDEEEQDKPHPLLDAYFQEQEHTDQDNAHFILKLIQHHPETEIKEKLYPVLVYYTTSLQDDAVQEILQSVFKSSEPIFSRVKFFSLVYKSISSAVIKKWLIIRSIALIEQESKISIFSNFVENFDALLGELSFNDNEYVEINLKLINYLQKHLVYKKLWKQYIVQTLLKTSANNAASPEVDALIIKLLKNAEITQETVALTSKKELASNKLYPFLQQLLLGDFEAFSTSSKALLSSAGIDLVELERNIKIQAIPRILNGIKNASYSQVSEILKIQKSQVESYIIEAIQNSLLKAKIDEFQETILIHQVKFRALRPEDTASLQKNISTLAGKLEHIASAQ